MTEAALAPSEAVLQAALDGTSALLGLPVAPEWREDVLFHLRTITAAALFVQAYPLDDERVAAPLFAA